MINKAFRVSIEPVFMKKRKVRCSMEKHKLDRINELARKSKAEGLTASEKEEQHALRQEFLAEIRADIRATLESIEIVDEVEEAAETIDELMS